MVVHFKKWVSNLHLLREWIELLNFLKDLADISSHVNHVNDAKHLLDDKEPPLQE